MTDQSATARFGQSRSLMALHAAAVAFFDPELIDIGFERLRAWMQETPALAFFAQYVNRLEKRQAHVRSGEVEQVLALTGDPFSGPWSVYSMLNSADLTFKPAASDGRLLEIGQASINSLVSHTDREVAAQPGKTTPIVTWRSRTPTLPCWRRRSSRMYSTPGRVAMPLRCTPPTRLIRRIS